MSLKELTLEGVKDRVQIAIDRLKTFEPPEGYYLAFSGGKDSLCVYYLAKMAEVDFDAHYNFTTVDPPELVRFIREYYPGVEIHRPTKSMFRLIVEKHFPPTRIARYCCEALKERGGTGRFVLTGIRHAESAKRAKRKMFHMCYKDKHKKYLHPIIDWSDKDVWQFIRQQKLKYCSLYDEGYDRLGCVMCPLQGRDGMIRDAERYPKFYKAYLKAFREMLQVIKDKGKNTTWQTEQDVMDWWINGPAAKKRDKNQMKLEAK